MVIKSFNRTLRQAQGKSAKLAQSSQRCAEIKNTKLKKAAGINPAASNNMGKYID